MHESCTFAFSPSVIHVYSSTYPNLITHHIRPLPSSHPSSGRVRRLGGVSTAEGEWIAGQTNTWGHHPLRPAPDHHPGADRRVHPYHPEDCGKPVRG